MTVGCRLDSYRDMPMTRMPASLRTTGHWQPLAEPDHDTPGPGHGQFDPPRKPTRSYKSAVCWPGPGVRGCARVKNLCNPSAPGAGVEPDSEAEVSPWGLPVTRTESGP